MKLSRSDVLRILDNVDDMSHNELINAANRLYEYKITHNIQNAVNANAFGATPMLVHMDASLVLKWMECDNLGDTTYSHGSSPNHSNTTPKINFNVLKVRLFSLLFIAWGGFTIYMGNPFGMVVGIFILATGIYGLFREVKN